MRNVYSRFGGKDGVVDELYSEGFHRLRAYVGLEVSRVGPADIDWETTFLGSLDALRLSMS